MHCGNTHRMWQMTQDTPASGGYNPFIDHAYLFTPVYNTMGTLHHPPQSCPYMRAHAHLDQNHSDMQWTLLSPPQPLWCPRRGLDQNHSYNNICMQWTLLQNASIICDDDGWTCSPLLPAPTSSSWSQQSTAALSTSTTGSSRQVNNLLACIITIFVAIKSQSQCTASRQVNNLLACIITTCCNKVTVA